MGVIRALQAGLSFFTVIPVPPIHDVDSNVGRGAIRALSVVGLLLGAVASLVAGLTQLAGGNLLAAVLAVVTLVVLTGGLHLDGVTDTADALGSRKPAEEALAIMKRSDIGPMGVIWLVLILLLDIAALAEVLGRGYPALLVIVLGPVVGRLTMLEAFRQQMGTARVGGFGALFTGASNTTVMSVGYLLVLILGAGAAWPLDGWRFAMTVALATALALLAGWLWRRFLTTRFGGLTGDLCGSIIAGTTTVFWLVAALGMF